MILCFFFFGSLHDLKFLLLLSFSEAGGADDPHLWVMNDKNKLRHEQTFNQAGPVDGKLTGGAAKGILVGTGLP